MTYRRFLSLSIVEVACEFGWVGLDVDSVNMEWLWDVRKTGLGITGWYVRENGSKRQRKIVL